MHMNFQICYFSTIVRKRPKHHTSKSTYSLSMFQPNNQYRAVGPALSASTTGKPSSLLGSGKHSYLNYTKSRKISQHTANQLPNISRFPGPHVKFHPTSILNLKPTRTSSPTSISSVSDLLAIPDSALLDTEHSSSLLSKNVLIFNVTPSPSYV